MPRRMDVGPTAVDLMEKKALPFVRQGLFPAQMGTKMMAN